MTDNERCIQLLEELQRKDAEIETLKKIRNFGEPELREMTYQLAKVISSKWAISNFQHDIYEALSLINRGKK